LVEAFTCIGGATSCVKEEKVNIRRLVTINHRHPRVVLLPGSTSWVVVVQMTLAQTTVLLAFGSKTTSFPALVDRVADPVDAGVSADGLVGWAEIAERGKVLGKLFRGED
jgi:hypothetical protein